MLLMNSNFKKNNNFFYKNCKKYVPSQVNVYEDYTIYIGWKCTRSYNFFYSQEQLVSWLII